MKWGIWRERCGVTDLDGHFHPWMKEKWAYTTKAEAVEVAEELNKNAKCGTSEYWDWRFSAKLLPRKHQ